MMTNLAYRRMVVKQESRMEEIGQPEWGRNNRPASKKVRCLLECGYSVEKNEYEMRMKRNRRFYKGENMFFICPWCESGEEQQID